MELIGLTTAMADVRGTISATLREIQKQRGQFQGYYTDATDVQATVEATENSLAVVQTHLSYAMGYDGLLSVPGTNSDNYGRLFSNLGLTFLVTRASDYWDLGRTFELMKSEIESYPYQYDWASAPDTINDGLNDLTDAFASTLAAIGVEVSPAFEAQSNCRCGHGKSQTSFCPTNNDLTLPTRSKGTLRTHRPRPGRFLRPWMRRKSIF